MGIARAGSNPAICEIVFCMEYFILIVCLEQEKEIRILNLNPDLD